jgi:SAM-dependent methyltransferase
MTLSSAHPSEEAPTLMVDTGKYLSSAPFIRPGDTVVDLSCGSGAGLRVLRQNSPGRKFIGFNSDPAAIDSARSNYANAHGSLEFRTGTPQEALSTLADHSIDCVLAFDIQLQSLLSDIRRVLIPGGRAIFSIQQSDGIEPRLLAETKENEIATAIRDPLDGAQDIPYRETVFANVAAAGHRSTDYARWYTNPWIVHPMVHVGYRVKSATLLRELAQRLLAQSPPDSADYGAALCILAYQSLASGADSHEIIERAERFLSVESFNPHVLRWRVSLAFVLSQIQLKHGSVDRARHYLQACVAIDPFAFSVHLATKTADAWFQLGWLALSAGDRAEARRSWMQGLAFGRKLVSQPLDDVLLNPADPNRFDHGDGMREFVLAIESITQCANGLHLLQREAEGVAVRWSDVYCTFRGKSELLGRNLREAQDKVASLNGELDLSREDLRNRTKELDAARAELVNRTAELDGVRQELRGRTRELDAVRQELVDRTEQLDAARQQVRDQAAALEEAQKGFLARLRQKI